MVTQGSRTLYSEHEAANILGVSIEQLRLLVRNHIVKDEDASADPVSTFHSSDLLLLRFLSSAAACSGAV
jgi:hypothetical protein